MKKKLFYEIMIFQILRKKYISAELTKQGLFFGQHHILEFIERNPGCNQCDLSTYLKVTPASIAISTKRLEKAGFIEKRIDEDNLRQKCLYLTYKGFEACKNMKNFFNNLDQSALVDITEDEIDLLEKLMDKMIFNYAGAHVEDIDINSLITSMNNKEEENNEEVN